MSQSPPKKPELAVGPVTLPPSEWSPRPISVPAPGRSTADPRTPTLRELAARAAQRASLAEEPRPAPAFTDAAADDMTEVEAAAQAQELEGDAGGGTRAR